MASNPTLKDIGKHPWTLCENSSLNVFDPSSSTVADVARSPYGNTILGRLTQSTEPVPALNEMNAFVKLVTDNLPPSVGVPRQVSEPSPPFKLTIARI